MVASAEGVHGTQSHIQAYLGISETRHQEFKSK